MQVAERRENRLQEWEEAIGIFRGVKRDEYSISILFDDFQLIFNSESIEAKIVERQLDGMLVGAKISILRTDLADKPLVIRVDGTMRTHPQED